MGANILSAIPLPLLYGIVSTLGMGGLVTVLWWVDGRRFSTIFARQQEAQHEHQESVTEILSQYKETVAEILKQYKADVNQVTTYYERNVELVERYEKLSDDLSGIIHLNTQVMTRLVESINNNMFCPVVRDAGPKRAN